VGAVALADTMELVGRAGPVTARSAPLDLQGSAVSVNPLAPEWLEHPSDANALDPAVWSRASRRSPDGALSIAGHSAVALAEQFGTPLFVLDEADARGRARELKAAFDREFAAIGAHAKIYYAGKAFLCTQVVSWMIDAGLNIDVCTGGELAVALAGGAEPSRIGMHGNNKSLAEIDRCVEVGVGAIVIDSVAEIARVAEAAQRHGRVQSVRLRINSGVHAHTHEYLATAREDQKFGITIADTPSAVAAIRSHASLRFLGLHSHIGSQIFESEGFAEAAHRLFEVHAALLEGGPVPELNLGGGFGIAYTSADEAMALDEIAARFAQIVADRTEALGIPIPVIAIEPGRAIIGPSTSTIYTVGTVKSVLVGPTAARAYVSVDGGMSDNARPALYEADYSVRMANRSSSADPMLVRVAGKHCESGDIVVRADYLPSDVAPGDLLAVPATGAYCWSLSSNYNYVGRPPVVSVREGSARVIVRGETEADVLSRDMGVEE
jgi:diaminopimelate decarboxylase